VQLADELLNLRRKLAWDSFEPGGGFHASEDKQTVREVAKDGLGVSRKESGDVGRYQLP
jgi:hypothetical protein